jgi:hypothetical protein
MCFEEATFELGSDVQTRQSRRDRIVSRNNEGHQDVVRGIQKLQIKAVDYGGAPTYVDSKANHRYLSSWFIQYTSSPNKNSQTHILSAIDASNESTLCMVEGIFLLHAVSASRHKLTYNGSATSSYNELNPLG